MNAKCPDTLEMFSTDVAEFERSNLSSQSSSVFKAVIADSFIDPQNPDFDCEGCKAYPLASPDNLSILTGYFVNGVAHKWDATTEPHTVIEKKKVAFNVGSGVLATNTNKKYLSYAIGTNDPELFVKIAEAGEAVIYHKDIDTAYQIVNKGMPESIFRLIAGKSVPKDNADLFVQVDDSFKKFTKADIKKLFLEKVNQLKQSIDQDSFEQPQAHEWKEPKPIKSELLPVQQLSQDMLPLEFKEYIFDEAIGADNMSPDMVAACLITSFASLIGAKVGVKPKTYSNWTIVPNLWGGIVAPPSSKKSPAFNAGTYPLDRLVATAREEFKEVKKKHEILSFAKDADKSALKSKIKDASKKGDEEKQKQLIEEMMQLEDEAQPILRRYKTNDSSPEALAELEKQNPNGVLVLRDELTGWLESVDKDPSERAFYLEAFNGDKPYEFDRILRGHGYIENHCLSILGGIQPDKLITYLEPSIKGMGNDGLFQRFQVLVYPDATEWQYVDRIPNKLARNEVFELFKQVDEMDEYSLVKMGANPTDDYNTRPYFRFGQKAQELYIKWTTDLHKNKIENEEHSIIAQHLQKYPKLMTSLALIFHIIDGIKFGSVGDISEQSADMAIQWCEYLESHARRIYGLVLDAATIKASSIGQKLLKLNAEHDWRMKGFKAREVHRKNWKGLTDIESVENALELLVDNNWLVLEEIEPTVKGGRPSKRYWINPRIYEMS
ncbi:YfjI family protein [Acinetobacter indicus]|uniref:YfjI family protein n=1 Tax=Acinetobacter TaxID=469 RepID=UPI0015D2F2A8|nr:MULTISPECIES: YfjI family protein [Acinetobacter]MCP0916747.1 YfjI family protein [Acinetobacter indicus]MCP0919860.1 YfjI family protein [Acinetobacter indicus]MCP0922527.1 YfjI family protein [Acinetobacter indicus]